MDAFCQACLQLYTYIVIHTHHVLLSALAKTAPVSASFAT
jgi:hypothetical protein|eukprot:COSAG01_NODE_757_length_13812_cov_11.540582_2_plen_40_part_00